MPNKITFMYIITLEIIVFISLFPKIDKIKEITTNVNQHILLIFIGKIVTKFMSIETLNKIKITIDILVYFDSRLIIILNITYSFESLNHCLSQQKV